MTLINNLKSVLVSPVSTLMNSIIYVLFIFAMCVKQWNANKKILFLNLHLQNEKFKKQLKSNNALSINIIIISKIVSILHAHFFPNIFIHKRKIIFIFWPKSCEIICLNVYKCVYILYSLQGNGHICALYWYELMFFFLFLQKNIIFAFLLLFYE